MSENFDVVAMRNELHEIPELGFKEEKTSDYVAQKLQAMGLEVTRGVGGTGVVAYVKSSQPGPTLLLRADMDALPFTIDGKPAVIHACGHDSHTAMLLATVDEIKNKIQRGTLKILFQPAEETLWGAIKVIEDGVLDDVDMALGCHVRPIQDIADGTVCAAVRHTASGFIEVHLKGRSAHGARPHLGASTVEAAVLIVNAVNSLWLDPAKAWSCKCTSIDCQASASNIIPADGRLVFDVRTQTNPLMQELLDKFTSAVKNAASAVGVEAEIVIPGAICPAAEYDETWVAEIAQTIKETLGDNKLSKDCGGGGEDFHHFVQKKPTLRCAYIGVGAGCTPGLHDPKMTLNAESLRNGVKVLKAVTLKILG